MAKHRTVTKFCAGCGTQFESRDRGSNRGWTRYCSQRCHSQTVHYKGGPEASRRRRRYGLEPEEHQRMLDEQGGRCALCRTKPKYDLYVDHHHATKKNRALLCARCNTAVGVFDQLSWDEVLTYWGYSHHFEGGVRLARAAADTLGIGIYDNESGNTPVEGAL